jgi:hypothetical protein
MSRSCLTPICAGAACTGSSMRTDDATCTYDSDGEPCGSCGGACSGGACGPCT